jgi:GGDEF domain-containing protein
MALLGPMVVVAENSAADVIAGLDKAGAFPIVEASYADAAQAIADVLPAAMVLAEPAPACDTHHVQALIRKIEARGGPFMPVLARIADAGDVAIPSALPVALDESIDRLIARLRSALRVRSLHATVLRRCAAANSQSAGARNLALSSLLDNATILCIGRGRSYPALTTAIGERVSLIGAMSVETAARYLKARDIDGVVIGDGFGPRVVEALLAVLAEDARFRDLPVGVLGSAAIDDERLPNLVRVEHDPVRLVECLLPLVCLQAFESHLKRMLKSLETDGVLDPETGLLARDAFWRDLDRAIRQAEDGGGALSVARFSFEDMTDRRASIDAARLFARLVRNIDFACQEQDGSILAAFTETDLRSAHVVARRIASVLRQTMLAPDRDRRSIRPTITLATLKSTDNLSTLVARVGTYPKVAVG